MALTRVRFSLPKRSARTTAFALSDMMVILLPFMICTPKEDLLQLFIALSFYGLRPFHLRAWHAELGMQSNIIIICDMIIQTPCWAWGLAYFT